MSVAGPKMAPRHNPARWEQLKHHILQAYLVENQTLREVVRFMATHHGFLASERMYKQRFKDWDRQCKTVRSVEWQAMDAIWTFRKQHEGKETVFIVSKGGQELSSKDRAAIEKHYKRDKNRAPLSPQEALDQLDPGVRLRWYTPTGSPTLSPQQPPEQLPDIPPISLADTDIHIGQQHESRSPIPAAFNRNLLSSFSPETSPFVQGMSTPLSPASSEDSQAYSDPDTSVSPSPTLSVEDLAAGFRGLTLKLNQPERCHISKEDELRFNQLLASTPNPQTAEVVQSPQVGRKGDIFAFDFHNLEEPLLVSSEWAASTFMACYWIGRKELQQAAAWKEHAMMMFEEMLRKRNDNVHTGLSWLVSILGSHSHYKLLEEFLGDCCAVIDRKVGPNMTFTPLYRYTLATVSRDQANILKYGKELQLCHSTIRSLWGPMSPNLLVSKYYLAAYYLEIGEAQQAVSLLEECLPLSETLMGRRHLVTINCMALLYRGYLDVGQMPRAVALLVDAIERSETALGKESPYRLELLSKLALVHLRMGQAEVAEKIFRDVLNDQVRTMGLLCQRTWWTIEQLEKQLIHQGRVGEARALKADMLNRHAEVHNDMWRAGQVASSAT